MNALVILTKNPSTELVEFYRTIRRETYDVFFLVDDNSKKLIIDDLINYIQIEDSLCQKYGYHSFNPIIKNGNSPFVSAWDKAIFYFANLNKSYNKIWFLEEDFFVPDINFFEKLDTCFLNEDILSAGNFINATGELEGWDWWWMAKESVPLPWAKSMVCAIRVSQKLMKILSSYVENNKNSYKFIEYIFHTLALHNDLEVKAIENLQGIVWRRDWLKEELNMNTLYHPVKSINQQTEFREHLITRVSSHN